MKKFTCLLTTNEAKKYWTCRQCETSPKNSCPATHKEQPAVAWCMIPLMIGMVLPLNNWGGSGWDWAIFSPFSSPSQVTQEHGQCDWVLPLVREDLVDKLRPFLNSVTYPESSAKGTLQAKPLTGGGEGGISYLQEFYINICIKNNIL